MDCGSNQEASAIQQDQTTCREARPPYRQFPGKSFCAISSSDLENAKPPVIRLSAKVDKLTTPDLSTPCTALIIAAGSGRADIVESLLSDGADITIQDKDGRTALHAAAKSNRIAVLKILLDRGADITSQDRNGWMALHVAADRNHEAAVRLLLAKGAPPLAKTKAGCSPIQLAGQNGHKEVFNILRQWYGLPPVAGNSYYPHLDVNTQKSSDCIDWSKQDRSKQDHSTYSSMVWPDQKVRDRDTGVAISLSVSDGRYWD